MAYRRKIIIAASINKIKPIIQQAIDKYQLKKENLNSLFNKIKSQIQQHIPSNSNEFKWYVQTFLQTADSIYDFLNQNGEDYAALQLLQQYYKLNKNQKKNFPLNTTKKFSDLKNFIDEITKQFKSKQFKQPKNAEKINIPFVTNYKVFKCDANNQQIQPQLQQITTIGIKPNGEKQHYTCWCVINGTKKWGFLTQSPWNYYYYITTKDNKPYLLMNFGDSGQINNIHDQTFSNWNSQLLKLVHYLMEKDGYNPKDNISDGQIFNTKFNQFDYMQKIFHKQINIDDLKPIVADNDYYLYYDENNDKYVIVYNEQIIFFYDSSLQMHRVNKYKFNENILNLLMKNHEIDLCALLIEEKFLQPQDKELYNQCLNFVCSEPTYFIAFLKNKILKINNTTKQLYNNIKNQLTNEQKKTIKNILS